MSTIVRFRVEHGSRSRLLIPVPHFHDGSELQGDCRLQAASPAGRRRADVSTVFKTNLSVGTLGTRVLKWR